MRTENGIAHFLGYTMPGQPETLEQVTTYTGQDRSGLYKKILKILS